MSPARQHHAQHLATGPASKHGGAHKPDMETQLGQTVLKSNELVSAETQDKKLPMPELHLW